MTAPRTPATKKPAVESPAPAIQALALRPREAAQALGIGETLLWSMTNRNEIPHVRFGRAILYPVADLQAWLSKRAAGGRATHA